MVTMLSKIFIKNFADYSDKKVRNAYGILCGALGIFLNLFISIFKFIAGTLTGSIAITADAVNNMADAGSSLITMIGFKLASKKPDPEHPFGHGRMEYVSGLIVALAIILMGVELLMDAISKITSGETSEFSILSVIILSVSILIKLYMAMYNRNIGKKINSTAMKATSTDSLSDCISTLVVLLSTLIVHFTGLNIDGWCGVLVSLVIIYAGIGAVSDTLKPLLGQPPEKDFVEEIEQIVMSNPAIVGIHDLVVHDYGPGRVLISAHAEVPAKNDILEMHDAIDLVEKQLNEELGVMATIHMDPIETDDEQTNMLKNKLSTLLSEIDESIQFHDFRIVSGPTHVNLIFDIVVKHGFRLSDNELTKIISQKVMDMGAAFNNGKDYFAVIQVDKDFT